jgi:hypothetical protein
MSLGKWRCEFLSRIIALFKSVRDGLESGSMYFGLFNNGGGEVILTLMLYEFSKWF